MQESLNPSRASLRLSSKTHCSTSPYFLPFCFPAHSHESAFFFSQILPFSIPFYLKSCVFLLNLKSPRSYFINCQSVFVVFSPFRFSISFFVNQFVTSSYKPWSVFLDILPSSIDFHAISPFFAPIYCDISNTQIVFPQFSAPVDADLIFSAATCKFSFQNLFHFVLFPTFHLILLLILKTRFRFLQFLSICVLPYLLWVPVYFSSYIPLSNPFLCNLDLLTLCPFFPVC